MSLRLPNWTGPERAGQWAAEVARILAATVASLQAQINRKQTTGAVIELPAYTVVQLADVPAATANQAVIVTDEVGGRTMALSDGTVWRRVSDGVEVS
jgi:hypothetical protein